VALYNQPAQFLRCLHDLLEFYNDLTYRRGQAGQIQPLLPHYKVPVPVMRQVEIELARLSAQDPQAGLRLADTLWMDPYFEPRLLAIYLLSLAPVAPPEPVLERLSAWAQPGEDRQVLDALITRGAGRMLREQPERWSDLAKGWLTSERLEVQSMGLRALLMIVKEKSFQNLPAIFRLLSPLMQSVPARLQADLLSVLQALAQRSQAETAYFFRQVLTLDPGPEIPRLIRRCLPYFTPEFQASLRQAFKSRGA